ncbi:hypothetical protein NL676_038334 [Syzygium grande]|nr:hypothetical protein NL676_038334 [Syzygium grande]
MRICWAKLGILHGPAFLPWRRPPYRLRRPRFATHQPSAGDPRQARGFASARQSRGCRAPDLFALNKRITHLVRAGRLGEARAAFDAAGCRNTVTWNAMITGYVKRGEMTRARELFDGMPQRDVTSWNLMISGYVACRGSGFVEEGRDLFERMPERDCVSWNTMISGYAKAGRMDEASWLFSRMPERNVVSWNTMVTGFLRNGDVERAVEFFKEMPERDSASLSGLVSGLIHNDKLDEAARIFLEHGNPDGGEEIVGAYNTLIAGYGQRGCIEEARYLFDLIPYDNDKGKGGARRYPETGKVELARDFFEKMPQKNLVSWNSVIAGYEKNEDYKGAVGLFIQMLTNGEKPDRHTLSSILAVATGLVDLCLGLQIHQLVTKTVNPDVPIKNSLITMYSRCGAIVEAQTIFDKVKLQKNVITWNAMIGGYASHGLAAEALELFNLMKRFEVRPTYITFISVLSACAHAGLVEEGWRHFLSMVKEYGIEPTVEHFASLVDIVGRHGQLNEALDIIKDMPMKPDKAVWGALLGACRVHDNVELARVAAEALMQLEPESSAPYILLYNMFADSGRWDDANESGPLPFEGDSVVVDQDADNLEGEEDIIAAKLQKLENASRTVLSDLRPAAFPRDIGRGELQRSP